MKNVQTHRGFTLLELLFSLTVTSIILSIGVPTFSNIIDNSERKTRVYELMGMLNFARDSAVSNSRQVVICPSDDSGACVATTSWSNTLMVFVDNDQNNKLDDDETILRVFESDNDKSVRWKSFGNKPYLSFDAQGTTGFQSGRLYYCQNGGADINDRAQIIIYRTGRSRIAAPNEFKAGC